MTSRPQPPAENVWTAGRTLSVTAVDYHAGGEPFRIVTGGVPPLVGATILDKRRYAREHLDSVRELLVFEPRGHADMYGCFVTEPNDDAADLGVVFFHNAGYSTACGHGTIALVTWALETGRIPLEEPETRVVVDVPSGRLETVAAVAKGRVSSVRFRNVPAYVVAEAVELATSSGALVVDLAFGGAFYASIDAGAVGLSVEPAHLQAFVALGRELKQRIEELHELVHPPEPELRDLYGVIFFQDESEGPTLIQRNVTVFADGEVDRSPCGSGTSARLALLERAGKLRPGQTLIHRSVVGTEFRARIVGTTTVGPYPAVITEVGGEAFCTGRHEFALDPRDPLGSGFLLR